jgi:hypothetical protein
MNKLHTLIAFVAVCLAIETTRADEVADFEADILPLLYQRCFSCHSEKREEPAADLKLDSVRAIRESQVIAPGDPEGSELLRRIALPHKDDEVMPPPKGGAQGFDDGELAMMKVWIQHGASFGKWKRFEHRQPASNLTHRSSNANDLPALTAKLDQLVEQSGGQRNAAVSDEVFLRRVYLDAIGRIPTLAESQAFLNSEDSSKRAKLIDRLLASEGFVSHMFNWKANQLRLDPRGIQGQPGWAYDEWVKESIRSGMKYDTFVDELITAEGYLWANAATGFYLRDQGMPLDHMSNLMRLFLGTRIECAQCHDHPFEPITQQDFYQLASYTYGVSVMFGGQSYDVNQVEHWPALKQRLKDENRDKEFRDSVSQTIAPLKRRTADTGGTMTYGEEFLGNPELCGDEVAFRTLFGDEAPARIGDRLEAFADWVTSPRNPRFARNIANRLWKRVFGVGLIEPVDSLSPVDRPEHPEILDYISQAIIDLGFDERAFLAMLFSSRLYQSESVRDEWSVGNPMELRGPWLRRLTAEQLWDSTLTLLVPDLDERKSSRGDLSYLENLTEMSADELWELAGQRLEIRRWHRDHQKQILDTENALRVAEAGRSEAEVAQLREKRDKLRRRQNERPWPDRLPPIKPAADPRWSSLNPGLVRASELTAPSRLGHYLRFFGQSDRREIDATNADPSITQSLALMNGDLTRQAADSKSLLRRRLADIAEDSARVKGIYQSILVRLPSEDEAQVCQRLFETSPTPDEDLIWALLNSPEFLFQQ